jgi:hypothetical protein
MAGMSFLRARSPVTPKMTRTHGPATRGIRRSRGSRSGLAAAPLMTSISLDGSPSASCSASLMTGPEPGSAPGSGSAAWVPSWAVVAESVITALRLLVPGGSGHGLPTAAMFDSIVPRNSFQEAANFCTPSSSSTRTTSS